LGDELSIRCASCGAAYDVVAGIPDLRLPISAWIDFDRDKAEARRLAAYGAASAEALAREVFQSRPHWTDERVTLRTRQVVEGPVRARHELAGWLAAVAASPGPVLEIGCGTGGLLAALPAGIPALGIDVSLAWLVVARRLLLERGRHPPLAAALGEAVPLPAACFGAIVALDVIEHVGNLGRVLTEVERVSAPGAVLTCSTPNRFSLGAEPHVGVWGVGWFPRPFQAAYVKARTGEEYRFARLLSAREALRLISRHTSFVPQASAPPIPTEEIVRFSRRRAALARAYNRLRRVPGVRALLLWVGPFFQITARKP